MSLPSRKEQIEAVAKFLDSDRNEGRSLEDIASDIVDGYHALLTKDLKTPDIVIRDGMLIKHATTGKVHRVHLLDGEMMWVVGETTGYGWLGPQQTNYWDGAEEYRPKKRIDGKMVEMTEEMIAEAWSNPDWKVGDRLSRHQRQYSFEVIATGPQCVLLKQIGVPGEVGLMADSNSNLAKYYRREGGLEAEW